MLTLTENATTIVKQITDQPDLGGIRIAAEDTESVALSAVPGPEPEDRVLEQDGATVYLDATAAEQLDGKILDAGVDEAGNLQFALATPQEPQEPQA